MSAEWPRRHPAPAAAAGAAQPLHGFSLILTRPEDSEESLAEALAAAGAEVLEAPAIEFADFVEQNIPQCRSAIEALSRAAGWLLLPSPAAVRHFAALAARLGSSSELLGGIHFGAIGAGSARALAAAGFTVDFVAPRPRGADLAAALPALPGTPVLIAGLTQTRPELRDGLALRGFNVQVLPLYAPRASRAGLAAIHAALAENAGRVLIVTSPSGADAVWQSRAQPPPLPDRLRWLAIGPTTAARLAELGIAAAHRAVAESPDAAGIAAALRGLRDESL